MPRELTCTPVCCVYLSTPQRVFVYRQVSEDIPAEECGGPMPLTSEIDACAVKTAAASSSAAAAAAATTAATAAASTGVAATTAATATVCQPHAKSWHSPRDVSKPEALATPFRAASTLPPIDAYGAARK
eukprot:6162545-Pleurochrysis_carterae.AAC.1